VSVPPRILTADRGDAGRRVDLVIRRHLTDLGRATRTRVQAWIEDGRVSVNGHIVRRVSTRAALGDTVTVLLPDEQPRLPVVPEEGPLHRIFEDDHLLVVNKPAGMVSHPTYLHPGGSLLNVLLWHAQAWPAGQRPSLVGRLDKLTSGALVVAKTANAHARLQRVMAASMSEKSYLAVVYGPVRPERGEIDLRLRRHPTDRRRVIAGAAEGLASLTRFERLNEAEGSGCVVTLMRCQLVTGRMHQVRVHMAASGWPLVGDAKYGEPRWQQATGARLREALSEFPRQALHAWRLSFAHPFTREPITAEAPVPDDLGGLIDACGLRGWNYSRNVSAAPGAVKDTSCPPAVPVTR
jgi:23S rRNA pseudouridine1911/1915/1917 synthase